MKIDNDLYSFENGYYKKRKGDSCISEKTRYDFYLSVSSIKLFLKGKDDSDFKELEISSNKLSCIKPLEEDELKFRELYSISDYIIENKKDLCFFLILNSVNNLHAYSESLRIFFDNNSINDINNNEVRQNLERIKKEYEISRKNYIYAYSILEKMAFKNLTNF